MNVYITDVVVVYITVAKQEFPKSTLFGLGASNRGEQRPVGRGIQRGRRSLGGRFPKEGRVFLLAHDFARQSLVCYTFCNRRRLKGIEASLAQSV